MTTNPGMGELQPIHLSVVVPAYNEEARIGATLVRMLEYFAAQPYSYELLVVDDGSTDATRDLVEKTCGGRVTVLSYGENRGKGHAVRHGMLRASGNYVLFSDADLATPIEEVEHLFAALANGGEVAIGSRDIQGAKLEKHQSPIRELCGKLFNRAVQLIAVRGIHDTQCGFKLFTHAAAQNIFGRCEVDDFSFDVEALFVARLLGYSIAEVPVRWAHQEGSKVRYLRDGLRMLRTLFRIKATDYHLKQASLERHPRA